MLLRLKEFFRGAYLNLRAARNIQMENVHHVKTAFIFIKASVS